MISLFFKFNITGNNVIHKLTNLQLSSLYVFFKFNNASTFYQKYEDFSIGDESTNYQLQLAGLTTGSLGTSIEVMFFIKK